VKGVVLDFKVRTVAAAVEDAGGGGGGGVAARLTAQQALLDGTDVPKSLC
jgi:hypothetical protein